MGLFSKPKRNCPRCGGALIATGYCSPYPAWKCPNCIQRNKEKKRIKELEERVSQLEIDK